jgi:hypothetical protein
MEIDSVVRIILQGITPTENDKLRPSMRDFAVQGDRMQIAEFVSELLHEVYVGHRALFRTKAANEGVSVERIAAAAIVEGLKCRFARPNCDEERAVGAGVGRSV